MTGALTLESLRKTLEFLRNGLQDLDQVPTSRTRGLRVIKVATWGVRVISQSPMTEARR
jgi:hypothetical protein